MPDYYDIARVLNALLAGGVVILAIMKARKLWVTFPFPAKLMYFSYVGMLLAIMYGSYEALVIDAEPGFRVSFFTGSLIVSLGAFLYPDEDAGWMLRLAPLRDKIGIK